MHKLFECCLYFSANRLAGKMNKLADKAFEGVDISPTHAFVMLVVNDYKSVSPGVIAKEVDLKPSTITRFIDALEKKEYVKRTYEGRTSTISLTPGGETIIKELEDKWANIYKMYKPILGDEFTDEFTKQVAKANRILKEIEE